MTDKAEHALIHLEILGNRDKYIVTVKNHQTGTAQNETCEKNAIIAYTETKNKEGYCVWISLNPKTSDGINGVTALADFWLDIDRPKATKHSDTPATQQELAEALNRARELQHYIETTYGCIGFLAYSGNGFHLHFPLPITTIEPNQCSATNLRVRAFAKRTAAAMAKRSMQHMILAEKPLL